MNYFIYDGQVQAGPFSFDELKIKSIQLSTPIWREGLTEWVAASQLEELQGMFAPTPPVYLPNTLPPKYQISTAPLSGTEKTGYKIGKSLGIGGVLLLILLLFLYFHNQSVNKDVSSNMPHISYTDPEHENPSGFLATGGTYKTNFWGNKEDIAGTITNKATHTNYKDVHIKVEFYSQTKSVVLSQEYIIYQYVPYGSTQNFSLNIAKPAAAASLGLGVVSATYY